MMLLRNTYTNVRDRNQNSMMIFFDGNVNNTVILCKLNSIRDKVINGQHFLKTPDLTICGSY